MELLNTLGYMEADVEFVASKPAAKVEEVIPAEMNITMKQVEHLQIQLQNSKNFSNGNDNRNIEDRADEEEKN
jgi:hypothetical protein